MPILRRASLGDARSLAALAERTFRETFGPHNTLGNLDLHCAKSYGEPIQAGELSDSRISTLVSEEGETLIGFAQLRWVEPPRCVSSRTAGEIQRLYVAREWHGRGVAHDLMKACLEEIKTRGCDVAWLGVWEKNPRAISFYRKFGFVEVGDHIFPLGHDPQRDIVMARPA